MPTLWQNALVIALDEEHGAEPFRADVLVDADRIVAVTAPYGCPLPPAANPPARPDSVTATASADPTTADPAGTTATPVTVIDATGLLLHPGLVNAHTHSWEILLRGTSDPLPLEVWTLLSYPPADVDPVPERLVYLRTAVAAIESLRGGVTTVLDDTGELPDATSATFAHVLRAYADAGIRATCTGTAIDVPLVDRLAYAEYVLPPALIQASREAMPPSAEIQDAYLAFCAEARELAAQHGDGRLKYAVAPSAPQRVTDELLLRTAAEALEHGEVLHTHLLETKLQQQLARTRYDGRTIVQHLHDLGVLGPNLVLAHGIWLTPGDLDLLAASGATVVHNPLSNLKLGSGVLAWRALHDAGVRVALGTDGASSNDSLSMHEVIKSAATLHTLTDPDYRQWPTVAEVLHAATVAGARAAGWAGDVGAIAPGQKADLVVVDLTRDTAFTPLNDAARQLVFAENGSSIHQVWVDGRLVVEDGHCTRVDDRALLAEFRREAAAYLQRVPSWRARQTELEPSVREAYLRAWAEDATHDAAPQNAPEEHS